MKNKESITKLGLQKLLENKNYKTGDFHQALLDIAYDDWQKHNRELTYEVFTRGENRERNVIWEGVREDLDKWWKEQSETRAAEMRKWNTRMKDGQKDWDYGDMLDNAREKYGELFFVLTLVGKYNQQVCNGGHIQYFDNGYGSRNEGGFGMDHDASMPLHREMIKEFEATVLPLAVAGEERDTLLKALDIMRDFKIRIDCDRYYNESCGECGGSGNVEGDDGEEERCGNCGGSGEEEVDNDNFGQPVNGDEINWLDDRWYEIEDAVMTALNRIAMNAIIPLDGGAAAFISMARGSFEDHFKNAEADREYLIPAWDAAVPATGEAGTECFRLLLEEKLKCGYLEKFDTEAGGQRARVFRKNRAKEASDAMYDTIRGMKVGDEIDYWKDVADRFDEADEDGNPRLDICKAYEYVIDKQIEYGTLLPLTENNNGNEITYGYRKIKK